MKTPGRDAVDRIVDAWLCAFAVPPFLPRTLHLAELLAAEWPVRGLTVVVAARGFKRSSLRSCLVASDHSPRVRAGKTATLRGMAALALEIDRVPRRAESARTHASALDETRNVAVAATAWGLDEDATFERLLGHFADATLRSAVEVLRPPTGREARATRTFASLVALTPRERAVAGLAVRGLSNREIAFRLQLQPATVKRYLDAVYAKTSVRNRTELVRRLAGP